MKLYMSLDGNLLKEFNNSRPCIDEIPLELVHPENVNKKSHVVGSIAETFVYLWLQRLGATIEGEKSYPINVTGGYVWRKVGNDIRVEYENNPLVNYDIVFFYKDMPFVAEVKAIQLDGYTTRIKKAMTHARKRFGNDVHLFIFMPLIARDEQSLRFKRRNMEDIAKRFPNVYCMDSGYSHQDIYSASKRFYVKLNRGLLNP